MKPLISAMAASLGKTAPRNAAKAPVKAGSARC